ncbi:hypothetical protein H8S20_17920 [Clostridium sp. NSJ-6]|uniref:Uncharacterized protein n=1 Tax=Clostridium hominis TaxID=2763036 RepID=A0ABR7DH46_9CLOT|nr:hypothetical protein [Clostridium hominis]MBC5630734.1 hypothetical protein [Clostridium hominis]MDU2672103.1 hypothetical protein [Clostridium sp.]
MIKEINEKLIKLKEEIVLKKILDKKLKNLSLQLEKDKSELYELEVNLKKEYKDVEKLKKLSFASILATVMSNKDEKLEKEQQEYIMAKIKYDEFSSKVELLKENIESIKSRLETLKYCENEYKALLNKKLELIKLYGDQDKKVKLSKIEEEIEKMLLEKKEIEEAESAGKDLLRTANLAKDSLNSAKNWGIFDIAGGDMLSSIAKHNKINEAEAQFRRVSTLINRFNKELGDIQFEGLSFSTTTIAFDIFFDNIFTDFSVQNKINSSLDNIRNLIRRVEEILAALNSKKVSINSRISNLRKDYDSIIESI